MLRITKLSLFRTLSSLSSIKPSSNLPSLTSKYYCTSSPQKDDIEEEVKENIDYLRDISGLSPEMKKQYHSMEPLTEEDLGWHPAWQKKTFKRKIFMKYGEKSGIKSSYLWPSKEELKEQIEIDAEFEPSLQQLMTNLEQQKKSLAAEIKEKDDHIEKQMAKMPKYFADMQAKYKKKLEMEQKQGDKRKQLLDEARDYFGFAIDPRDPRFEQMKEMKEEEEKLAKKKRKKEAKLASQGVMPK